MNNVIGYKDTEDIRLKHWNTLRESKRSYETFRRGPSEQEKSIASLDKRIYDHYLSKYIGETNE